jgi:hypothetical protein
LALQVCVDETNAESTWSAKKDYMQRGIVVKKRKKKKMENTDSGYSTHLTFTFEYDIKVVA